jgi:DNA-binding beta-propeller fold protein YncE
VSDDGKSNGALGQCTDGRGLSGARSVAVSGDGSSVYVASETGSAVAVFSRTPGATAVTQLASGAGCSNSDASDGCTATRGMGAPRAVTVSPDKRNVYVATAGSQALVSFVRDTGGGALTQLAGAAGCVSEDGSSGACGIGRGLNYADGLAVSGDGRSIYVEAIDPGSALAVFDRGGASGAPAQLAGTPGCLSDDGTGGACTDATIPAGGGGLVLSPDGLNLYALPQSDGISVFSRELPPRCTAAAQVVPALTPTPVALDCTDPNGDPITRSVVSGPGHGSLGAIDQAAGRVTYTPSAAFFGTDTFGFAASDGSLTSEVAGATLNVARDVVKPVLSSVRVSPRAFFAAGPTSAAAKTGTTFRYRLSEASRVSIAIDRVLPGRRVGRKCRPVTRRNRQKRHCTRYRRVGSLSQSGKRRLNRRRFSGRLRGKALAPGVYRATLSATDAQKNRSKARTVRFRVKPRKHA